MIISELMEILRNIKEREGDIEVVVDADQPQREGSRALFLTLMSGDEETTLWFV